jgi:hypothetical protein
MQCRRPAASPKGKDVAVKWSSQQPPGELVPTEDLQLTIARAILKFMEGDQNAAYGLAGPSIWDIADQMDPRLRNARFPNGSELERIWEISDTYSDAVCEPDAYVGSKLVEGYKQELIQWATKTLAQGRHT